MGWRGSPHRPTGFAGQGEGAMKGAHRLGRVPVSDAECRAQIDAVFQAYIDDPSAWELGADGEYVRRRSGGVPTQELLLNETALAT